MQTKITWQEARDLLLSVARPVEPETLPLERVYGRILAADVTAAQSVPPFDRSPFDCYAFRSADTEQALPVTLSIVEEIPAGSVPTRPILPGTAAKILTGAPIPEGADAVTKYEETDFTEDTVTLKRPYRASENVIFRGEDVAVGEVLARAGDTVDPGLAGALCSQGIGTVSVHRVPVVGVITTGSELVELGSPLASGKIPNSNRFAFSCALQSLGIAVRCYPSPADTVDEIAGVLNQALADCDAVITTGGVSGGDYDLTALAYEAVGAKLLCGDLRLKPGGKSCFAQRGDKLLLGLSGNPASAMTCYYAVVLPVLRRLRGEREVLPPLVRLPLGEDFRKKSPQPRLVRGKVAAREGELAFYPAGKQGNGALHSLAGCNAMAEIKPGAGPLSAGAPVDVFYFGN